MHNSQIFLHENDSIILSAIFFIFICQTKKAPFLCKQLFHKEISYSNCYEVRKIEF
jgi:hypothetical protein